MIRFLHSGDWQLGMTRSVLDEAAQARFADARFDAIRRIGEVARRERCDFVLVCGDVFESSQVDRRTLARALDALAGVGLPVFLLPGNHDPLDAASIYASRAFRNTAPPGVEVLESDGPREVAPGVELVAAPWRSRRPERNPALAALERLGPVGPLRILAAHGGLDTLTPERRDATLLPTAPLEAALAADRLHYVALGDRHSLTRLADGRICYAGAPVATDWGERAPNQALVVELDREGVASAAHRIGDWRFVGPERAELAGPEDLDALAARLDALEAKERTALRLELAGRLDLRGAARLETLLERARDLLAGLDLRDAALRVAAEPADLDGLDLSGFALRAVRRLREEGAGEGEDALRARDALALLVRLAEGPTA